MSDIDPRYEQGYRDGESSFFADVAIAFDEILHVDVYDLPGPISACRRVLEHYAPKDRGASSTVEPGTSTPTTGVQLPGAAPIVVWIVREWEIDADNGILGVYSSSELARERHPGAWDYDSDDEFWSGHLASGVFASLSGWTVDAGS